LTCSPVSEEGGGTDQCHKGTQTKETFHPGNLVLDHVPFSFITNNDVPHWLPRPGIERAGAGRWSARRKTAVILELLRGADLESTSQFTNPAKPRSDRTDEAGVLGVQLSSFSNLDASVVRLSALKAKFDLSLSLFADVILNPAFPQEDFARQQKLQLAAIQREKVTGISIGLRVFPGLLYGKNHSYGNSLTGSGTEESVARLSREDLVKFHQTWFRPNNATLVVVGDITTTEITPKIERLFAGWAKREVPAKDISRVQFPAKPVVYIVDRPGALQSDILVGQVTPPRNSPDQIAIETMNSILGSDFGARININLREDKHWSYGAQTVLFAARGQQPFLAYAPVQSDKTKESVDELNKEFHGLVNERPPTATELQRAQNTMTLKLPGSRETIDEVGNSILEQVQFGLPDDYYETFSRKVRSLDISSVTDAAKSTIRPDNLVWVVVGDRAKIESSIRQLGLGEVKFLDADGNPI
jgi:zinc protease